MISNTLLLSLSQPKSLKKYSFFLNKHFGIRKATFIRSILHNIQQRHGLVSQGQRWIYNTAEKWAQKLKCSTRTFERDIKELREKGFITIKHLYPIRSVRTNCYRVNEDKIMQEFFTWQDEEKKKAISSKTRSFLKLSTGYKKQNGGMKAISNLLVNKSSLSQGEFLKNSLRENTKGFFISSKHQHRELYACDYMLREWNNGLAKPLGLKREVMSLQFAKYFNAAVKCIGLTRKKWSDLLDALRRSPWFRKQIEKGTWKITLKEILRFPVLKRMLQGGYGIGYVERFFGLPSDIQKVAKASSNLYTLKTKSSLKNKKMETSEKEEFEPRVNYLPHVEEIPRDQKLLDLANNGGWAKAIFSAIAKEPKKEEVCVSDFQQSILHVRDSNRNPQKVSEVSSPPAKSPPKESSPFLKVLEELVASKRVSYTEASSDNFLDQKEAKMAMWRQRGLTGTNALNASELLKHPNLTTYGELSGMVDKESQIAAWKRAIGNG